MKRLIAAVALLVVIPMGTSTLAQTAYAGASGGGPCDSPIPPTPQPTPTTNPTPSTTPTSIPGESGHYSKLHPQGIAAAGASKPAYAWASVYFCPNGHAVSQQNVSAAGPDGCYINVPIASFKISWHKGADGWTTIKTAPTRSTVSVKTATVMITTSHGNIKSLNFYVVKLGAKGGTFSDKDFNLKSPGHIEDISVDGSDSAYSAPSSNPSCWGGQPTD